MKIGAGIGWGKNGNKIPSELAAELRGIPRTKIEWLAEPVALAAIIAHIVLLLTQYATLPALVPTHFGFDGLPNGYGAKSMMFVFLAGSIILYITMTALAAFPASFNFPVVITRENFQRQYLLMRYMVAGLKVLVTWLFFYISYQAVAVALSRAVGIGPGLWLFVGFIILCGPLVFALSYKWR